MSNSKILKTPHRTASSPTTKFAVTPCSGFNNLTLNSTSTGNGRIKQQIIVGRPSNFNDKLNAMMEEDEDPELPQHPNLQMVIGGNKIAIDHILNNDHEKLGLSFGSDEDENDNSEDDELSNSFSPGRMSISPDRGFPQKLVFDDDDNDDDVFMSRSISKNNNKKVERSTNEPVDDDIFMSRSIPKKNDKVNKSADDIFMSTPIQKKDKKSEKSIESTDNIFMSTSIIKKYGKDPYLDTSSSWMDDIYYDPKSTKNNKHKNNNNNKGKAAVLIDDNTDNDHNNTPSIINKENEAPSIWSKYFDGQPKYSKIPKETDANNHSTYYTGPLCEISVIVKNDQLSASTSNSSSSDDDHLHVRKKKLVSNKPHKMRFMRSLSPIRSDPDKRKGKESCQPNNDN